MNSQRRNDIDVLRAIAILPVVIFHFKKELFPNGYLGVDIFFVISGFLIGKILLKSINNKKFSFIDFYSKRILRIVPALIVLIIFSILFSVLLFFNNDLRAFFDSLLSSLFFVSNIFFWVTGGYFGSEDQLKPLLHIWSLAVEAQFYLFISFIFIFFRYLKNSYNYIFFITLTLFFISLIANIFLSSKGHRDSLFFLFPFRLWEFTLGIFVSLIIIKKKKYLFSNQYLTYFGLFLIIFNYFHLPVYFNLPSAFLICTGTAIVLYSESIRPNYKIKLFNFNYLIYIGLISYSLYLWHWPIVSFLEYFLINELNYLFLLIIIVFTFYISYLSWRFVEKPFLKSKLRLKKIYYRLILIYIFFISIVSLFNYSNFNFSVHDKYFNNLSNQLNSTYRCSFLNYNIYGNSFGCFINNNSKKDYSSLIFGNSHAAMYGWLIEKKAKENNQKILLIHLNDCLPLISANKSIDCLKKANKYYENIIKDKKIKKVLIGLTWESEIKVDSFGKKINDDNFTVRNRSLLSLINLLKTNEKEVFLLGPIPTPSFNISAELRKRSFQNKENHDFFIDSKIFYKKHNKSIDFFTDALSEKFLRPDKILCDASKCYFLDNKNLLFSDGSHLSKYGSLRMEKIIKKIKFD